MGMAGLWARPRREGRPGRPRVPLALPSTPGCGRRHWESRGDEGQISSGFTSRSGCRRLLSLGLRGEEFCPNLEGRGAVGKGLAGPSGRRASVQRFKVTSRSPGPGSGERVPGPLPAGHPVASTEGPTGGTPLGLGFAPGTGTSPTRPESGAGPVPRAGHCRPSISCPSSASRPEGAEYTSGLAKRVPPLLPVTLRPICNPSLSLSQGPMATEPRRQLWALHTLPGNKGMSSDIWATVPAICTPLDQGQQGGEAGPGLGAQETGFVLLTFLTPGFLSPYVMFCVRGLEDLDSAEFTCSALTCTPPDSVMSHGC